MAAHWVKAFTFCSIVFGVACDDVTQTTDTDSGTDTNSDTETGSGTDTETGSGTETETETETETDVCAALPTGDREQVNISPSDDLEAKLEALTSGQTAVLAAGTYALSEGAYITLRTDDVHIRGATGNAEDVVIDGNSKTQFGLSIQASDVTVTDLTIQRTYYHPVHVTPGNGRSITGTVLHRVRIIDGAEQAIKINTGGDGKYFADDGVISCSTLRMTDAGRSKVRNNCYTGGVDAHQASGWHIHDNHIEGFWCESGLSEHGVHMWRGCRDTIVERNMLVNNARGIGFGLGQDDKGRRYEDKPCGGTIAQSYNETAVNNMVFTDDDRIYASGSGFDVGIGLESACDATVLHNSVYSTKAPFSSIEYRFGATSGVVANNLVSHNVRDRGAGDLTVAGNLDKTPSSAFIDAAAGDLHLAAGATAIDAAVEAHTVDDDFDGDVRTGKADVGADER